MSKFGIRIYSIFFLLIGIGLFSFNASALSIVHDTSAEFSATSISSGTFSNVTDTGSGSSPNIQLNSGQTDGIYTSGVIDLGVDILSLTSINWTESGIVTSTGEIPFSSTGLVAKFDFNEISNSYANNKIDTNIPLNGGSLSYVGGYRIHKYLSTGSLSILSGGERTVEALIVAGGGGGGYFGGGGGGAGGVIYRPTMQITTPGVYPVTVGNGGAGGNLGVGSNGGNSYFNSVTATGGGGGGAYITNGGALNGGSGGGTSATDILASTTLKGTGISGQGNNGGTTVNTAPYPAAGGGGAGAVGSNGLASQSGKGGNGIAYSISGESVTYGGGGGGAGTTQGALPGAGGTGGGGAGSSTSTGANALANTGGGGGGGKNNPSPMNGGSGGSGIVIVRYVYPDYVLEGGLNNFSYIDSQDQISGTGWTSANKKWGQGALMFDGANDYVEVPDHNNLDMANNVSIESWVYLKSSKTNIIASKRTGSISNYQFWVGADNKLNFSFTGGSVSVSNTAVTLNQWTYVACAFDDSTNTVSFYINGVLDVERTETASMSTNTGSLFIGRDGDAGTNFANFYIDSTRIYSRALTLTDAQKNYKNIDANVEFQTRTSADNITWEEWTPSGINQLTDSGGSIISSSTNRYIQYRSVISTKTGVASPSLSSVTITYQSNPTINSISPSYGPIEGGTNISISGNNFETNANIDTFTKVLLHSDGIGNNFIDSSSYFNTVSAYGNITQTTNQHKFGTKSMYLNGAGDYLGFNHSSEFDFGSGDMTIDTWVYSDSWTGVNSIYAKWQQVKDFGDFIFCINDGKLQFYNGAISESYTTVASSGNVPVNQWVHVAIVKNNNVYKLYINGVNDGSSSNATPFRDLNLVTSVGTFINYDSSFTAFPFKGYIDEFRVSKGIARWTSNFTPLTNDYSYAPIGLTIGGVEASNIVVVDSSTITATTPSHIGGSVDVVVTNPYGGTKTMIGGYYYGTPITNTPTPTPTLTPTNTPTPEPTLTSGPLPPTETPTPTLTPIPGGTTIQNLSTGIVPVLKQDWNTNLETTAQTGVTTVGVEDTVNANIKVAEIDVNFNTAPVWTGVTGATDENIAFFHSTNPISTITNGAATSYSLYIRKGEGDKVWICPGAASLSEVTLSCSNGYFLSEGQTLNGATASVVSIDSLNYWKVSGLTGTGGMSVITGLKDTLSRLQVSSPSDHTISFGTSFGLIAGSSDTMALEFPDFDLTGLTLSDIELTDIYSSARTLAGTAAADTWGVTISPSLKTITFSVPTSGTGGYSAPSQVVIKIGTNAGGTNQIINPSSVGNFTETITLNNTNPGEMGQVNIPIVDADTVDITGYVTAYIHFDIDTNTDNTDCNASGAGACLTHSTGSVASNYTVDLGELTSAIVNKSLTSAKHSDGANGLINSIYFDLTTNAPSGAVVTVKSLNGGLQGPASNTIPSIGITIGADGITRFDGEDIPANSGVYGYNLPVASTALHGTVLPNSLCDSLVKFCGAPSTTPKTVFTTNNLPIDTARVRLDLAAAANYTNNPGVYTDTLTFVATATF